MKIIYNRFIPSADFRHQPVRCAFVKGKPTQVTRRDLNHELIHTAQMRELGYVPFYILYVLEWIWRLFRKGNAYSNISFEREAYAHQNDPDYLHRRPRFAQWRR